MRIRALTPSLAAALLASAALAQPAPAPRPDAARSAVEAPAPRADASRTYTFQIVLLAADFDGPTAFEHVPANARKALEDVRDFLPYKSYQLLDMAWLRSSRYAEAQLAGPQGASFSARIDFHPAPEPGKIEVRRFVLIEPQGTPRLLEAPRKDGAPTAIAPAPPVRPAIESTFGMDVGETVVVGTARLDGPSRALVALLTVLP